MDLFSLVASLTLDKSNYDSGLDEAEGQASSFGNKIKGAMAVGGAAIAAVTGATVALTGAFVKGAGQVAAYGDNIDKASQKLGISAEAYQEWDAILQHSGSSAEALAMPMRTLRAAAEEGKDAFDKLGFSQEQVASMSAEELFSSTITALQGITDENERAALATDLLGRGAMEMGALLNTSAEDTEAMRQKVHELGGVMSDESVKAAAAFQDSLQDLQTSFGGLKRGLTEDFLPGITTVMDGLTEIFGGDPESGIAKINEGVDSVLTGLTDSLPVFLDTGVAILESLLEAFIQNLPKLLEMGGKLVGQLIAGLIANIPALVKSIPELVMAIINGLVAAWPSIRDAGADIVTEVGNGLLAVVDKAKEWGGDLLQSFIDGITAKFAALRDAVSRAAQTVKNFLGFSEPEEGPLSNFHTFAPDMIDLFAKGIRDGEGTLRRQLGSVSDTIAEAWAGSGADLTAKMSFGSAPALGAGAGGASVPVAIDGGARSITIDLTAVLDGAIVARKLHSYDLGEANRVGVPLVQGD